jgi:hypothetical protein
MLESLNILGCEEDIVVAKIGLLGSKLLIQGVSVNAT